MLNDLRWIRQTRRTCFGHSKLTRSPLSILRHALVSGCQGKARLQSPDELICQVCFTWIFRTYKV